MNGARSKVAWGYFRLLNIWMSTCVATSLIDKPGQKFLALHATKGSTEYYTPPYVFDALGCTFDVDVASPGRDVVPWIPAKEHYTEGSLERDWHGFVWCNPPYGRGTLDVWLAKFRDHGDGIALTVDRTSTRWWQTTCSNADLILFVKRKIQFIMPGGHIGTNALGSTLIAYGERGVSALLDASCAGLGAIFTPKARA